MSDCPNVEPLACLTSETKRWVIGGIISSLVISIWTMASVSAKADKIVTLEEKIDYLYRKEIERSK